MKAFPQPKDFSRPEYRRSGYIRITPRFYGSSWIKHFIILIWIITISIILEIFFPINRIKIQYGKYEMETIYYCNCEL